MRQFRGLAPLLLATAAGLFASGDADRRIEQVARTSYNYRTVLGDAVDVNSNDGVVTLSGRVQDRGQRALAEDTVAGIPGVVRVSNRIQVFAQAPEGSDQWIALEIRSLLLEKAHVSAASTTVDVGDGVVTLGGTADSVAQKDLTELYASSVEGVTSVRNEIVVINPSSYETGDDDTDDVSITGQMRFELLSRHAASAIGASASTEGGVVTITGEVGSETEKTLITKLAETIRGVKAVRNEMTVRN